MGQTAIPLINLARHSVLILSCNSTLFCDYDMHSRHFFCFCVDVVARTRRHRLSADEFPMFSGGWPWQGLCRDLEPCESEQRAVSMM